MTQHPEPAQLSHQAFERMVTLAVSPTARVELCRIVEGDHHGSFAAVKRLPHELSEDPELRAMFRDEIWMATALDHPNVARVLGWGEDDDGLFLASEFVRGVSLNRLMRTVFSTGEAFTERLIVFLAAKVCSGLAAAHNLRSSDGVFLNLVHRDLTPGNILCGFDGAVKITDFGLAKASQRVTQTAVGMTKGDPAYMSPEQVYGKVLDGRSDLFALGIVLFELFAQRRPWTVNNVDDALKSIVGGKTPDLKTICPRIDPTLVAHIERCLAKKPDDRFASASELETRLDEWLMLHGYRDSADTLARFVRRNAMRQMRWMDRAMSGDLSGIDAAGPSPLELSRDEPMPPLERGDDSRPIELRPIRRDEVTEATTMRRPHHGSISSTPPGRMRDAAPPLGATDASVVIPREIHDTEPPPTISFAQPHAEHTPIDAPDTDTDRVVERLMDEPSTLRQSPIKSQLMEIARRVSEGASALADKAGAAAQAARAAAQHAEHAARHAHQMASRAEHAAEAVRLAGEAVRLAELGEVQAAIEAGHRAEQLHRRAVSDDG
jgi:serine/threonine protein kinase